MLFRTDLASERREILGDVQIPGVEYEQKTVCSTPVSEIRVCDSEGERQLGKPCGRYITVDVPAFTVTGELTDGRLDAVCESLRSLLPAEGCILAVGLGNPAITPDALGPRCAGHILATRHIGEKLRRETGLEGLRSVAVLQPGVLGCTGMEAVEIIAAVAHFVSPCAVITIDALAAQSVHRLARTVQMSDAGIAPGSGVGNHRAPINRDTVGFPVISLGVPTVVDAGSLIRDATGNEDTPIPAELENMILTPRETDTVTDSAAKLLSLAVNRTLQPTLSAEELLSLV